MPARLRHPLTSSAARFLPVRSLTPPAGGFLLLIGLWLACLAWMRPLTLPDEGRYAGVAWEMLRSGSHAVPLLDGMPYFHKPPLYYWLAELGFSLFGVNEWAARFPSWLAAWASLAGLYVFVRQYRDAATATITTLILATLPFYFGGAQFANIDMLVAGLITLCTLAAADAVLRAQSGRPFRWMSLAAAALAGLAVLAKGLIGLLLPGAILFLWMVMTRRWRGFGVLCWPPALGLFALVAVPWFWMMQQRFPGFFDYFFIHQHFERFAQSGFNNKQPFWFYLPVAIGLLLPWTLWAGAALRKEHWRTPDLAGMRSLMLIWAAVILVFFSIPSSKLIGYILPAMPPLAALLGEAIMSSVRREPSGGAALLLRVCAVSAVLLCVVLAGVAAFNPRGSAAPLARQLAAEISDEDTLVMLYSYPFDLALYSGTRRPAWVLEDWDKPDIPVRDNWRRELFDAERFIPPEAEHTLVRPAQFLPRLCAAPEGSRFWMWGGAEDGSNFAPLQGRTPRFADKSYQIWRVDINQAFREQECRGLTAGRSSPDPGR